MAVGEPVLDNFLDSTLGDSIVADGAKVFGGAWLSGSKMPAVKVAGIALAVIGARDGVKKLLSGGVGSLNLGGLLGGTSTTTSSTSSTDATSGGLYA